MFWIHMGHYFTPGMFSSLFLLKQNAFEKILQLQTRVFPEISSDNN